MSHSRKKITTGGNQGLGNKKGGKSLLRKLDMREAATYSQFYGKASSRDLAMKWIWLAKTPHRHGVLAAFLTLFLRTGSE